MRRVILCGALALSLTACATTQNAAMRVCENYDTVRAGLLLALTQLDRISDFNIRDATRLTLETSLRALDTCPQARGLN